MARWIPSAPFSASETPASRVMLPEAISTSRPSARVTLHSAVSCELIAIKYIVAIKTLSRVSRSIT